MAAPLLNSREFVNQLSFESTAFPIAVIKGTIDCVSYHDEVTPRAYPEKPVAKFCSRLSF
jgi:hypothetical protein